MAANGEITRKAPEHFDEEILDVHLDYTYGNGWPYTLWVKNHERVVYSIRGGPLAGRRNYQTAYYQRVRKNIWQVSWVEETGTTVTITIDLEEKRLTTFIAFFYGHWTFPEKAVGYKRTHMDQWRELSKLGNTTTDKHPLPEQADIERITKGKGELEDIDMSWETL